MSLRLRKCAAAFLAWVAAEGGLAQTTAPDRLRETLDRIASGDAVEAEDAARRLTRDTAAPLRGALDGLHRRSAEEQFRVLLAVDAALAEMRAQAYRATLPDEDRTLFDEFQTGYPELVRRLFDDNPDERRAALDQLPREPGGGAGVLLAALAHDENLDLAEAALRAARGLKDPVLHRNLRRYAGFMLELMQSETLVAAAGGSSSDYAIVFGQYLLLAAEALASGGDREALPLIQTLLERYSTPPLAELLERAPVYRALADGIGEAAAPVLLRCLEDARVERTLSLGPGQMLVQKSGDVALAALLKIYGQPPAAIGMLEAQNAPNQPGFADDVQRRAAQKQFIRWHAENGPRPAAERQPLIPPGPGPRTAEPEPGSVPAPDEPVPTPTPTPAPDESQP